MLLIMSNLKAFSEHFLMHNFTANLSYFIELAKECFKNDINDTGNFRFYPRQPKLSDIQLIAMSALAEAEGIDSENLLFAQLKSCHPDFYNSLPDRTNYNRRKRRLRDKVDEMASYFSAKMTDPSDKYLVDSMPIPICRIARAKRCRIMRDDLKMLPKKGYQPIDKQYYHGYKIHALTTHKGVITSYFITQANVHDVTVVKDLSVPFINNATLIGDKGYLGKQLQLDLFDQGQISLYTPTRNNMEQTSKWKKWMGRLRKRIETVFSQQCDQFQIKRNYAKSFDGLFARITAKFCAYTLLQYTNYQANRPLGLVKHALLF
jgi:Transposase DDE domain